jgi:hypothetical protein
MAALSLLRSPTTRQEWRGRVLRARCFRNWGFRNCMDDSAETLQRLHDSEINAELSCFYDCGWRWRIGDNLNGWMAES